MRKPIGVLTIMMLSVVSAASDPVDCMDRVVPGDYSYGYWRNAYRRVQGDSSPDALCLETGAYGFMIEPKNLSRPRFGLFDTRLDYQKVLEARSSRMDSLDEAQLDIELEVNGRAFRAESSRTRFSMWDSGRVAQYFTLLDLNFTDESGKTLNVYGDLNLVAWPGSLSFTVDALEPTDRVAPGRAGNGWYLGGQPLDIPHRPEMESEHLTLEMWVKPTKLDGRGWLICKNENEWGTGHFGIALMHGEQAVAVMNNAGGARKEVMIPDPDRLKVDTWFHLVLTYDGKVMRFYINGAEKGNKTIGIARQKGNGHLRIGQRADGKSVVSKGVYDQVRLWNRALSADEVKMHWQAPDALSNRNGLVLEKTFDEKESKAQADWQDVKLRLALKTDAHNWKEEKIVKGVWKLGEKKQISLNCNLDDLYDTDRNVSGTLTSTYQNQRFPIAFDPIMNCYVGEVKGLERSFASGYVKITDYDEFDLVLDCSENSPEPVPFLFYLKGPANVTGLVPILCKPDGTPTGIPVQLSKNWHNRAIHSYLRAYALIPVKQGRKHYRLRVAYGFYGSIPSASHGQLCLLGGKGGGGQRWDQLALACGGESLCLDIDQSLTDMVMTDIRIPLGRFGKDGNPWGWTEGGWGGEWLGVFDGQAKLPMAGMKAAYQSHGPCLTDVRYSGAYGSDRAVLLDAKVEFPRSDDYARTFQKVNYRFQKELSAEGSYLHRLYPAVPDNLIAYGNADGLLGEVRVAANAKKGDVLIPPTEMTGPGPWWVAFPEREKSIYTGGWKESGWVGYPAIIIRDYKASFGGKPSKTIWLTATQTENSWRKPGVDTRFVAGPDVTTYKQGDYVEMDLEWAHLVAVADNYGWNNQAYIKALQDNPNSWKVAHREAVGNDIKVTVEGGKLLQKLPVVIQANKPEVTVTIQGGVGHLPIRFEGLKTPDNYVVYEIVDGKKELLDQSVHGKDYWQTDYDSGTGTYKMSFNLPVDGKPTSKWVLTNGKEIGKLTMIDFKSYVDQFNALDEEEGVNTIHNKDAFEFMADNIPSFDCPDKDIERTWYYRWWTYRKHLRETEDGWVVTEFYPDVGWAKKHNTINCPVGHQIYEGRWLRDPKYINEYIKFHFYGGGNPGGESKGYSNWLTDAIYAHYLVTGDNAFVTGLLDELITNHRAYSKDGKGNNSQSRLLEDIGLYWQIDSWDGSELSISGHGIRLSINSYLYGGALAIAKIADLAGKAAIAQAYRQEAETLKQTIQAKLWDPEEEFFKTMRDSRAWNYNHPNQEKCESGKLVTVRELYGYTPWYFNMPDADKGYEVAWTQLTDPQGFKGEYGPGFAERRHPKFTINNGGCVWAGSSWPMLTSQVLTGLANLLNNYEQDVIGKQEYFDTLCTYARSHVHKRDDGTVVPWVDESLNQDAGRWISIGQYPKTRGRYYNHSSYCDLIITGLVGLRPRADDIVEVNPLLPDDAWEYFCLDNVRYRDHLLTIIWDSTGKRYDKGKGLTVLAAGKKIAHSDTLGRVTAIIE